MCKEMCIKTSIFNAVFIKNNRISPTPDTLNIIDETTLKVLFNPKALTFIPQEELDYNRRYVAICGKLILTEGDNSLLLVHEKRKDGDKISIPGGHFNDIGYSPDLKPHELFNLNVSRELFEEFRKIDVPDSFYSNLEQCGYDLKSIIESYLGFAIKDIDSKYYYIYRPEDANYLTIYKVVNLSSYDDTIYAKSLKLFKDDMRYALNGSRGPRSYFGSNVEDDIRCNNFCYIPDMIFNTPEIKL